MSHEVGIIGAGAHGATAAYHLARRGVSTIVFERGTAASGPTGRASGVVRSYYTNAFLAEVARQSTAVLAHLPDEIGGGESGYVRTGALYLHDAAERADVELTSTVLGRAGVQHSVLSAGDLTSRFPAISLDGVGIGVWEHDAGHADPYRTTVAYAARAAALGAEVRLGSRVERLEERPEEVVVELADGTRHTVDRLLVAAGPWTAPLLAGIGVDLPLTAERHVVAELEHTASTRIAPLDHVLIDLPGGYYSRPGALPGRFVLGPLAPTEPTDPDAFSTALGPDERVWLHDRAAWRVPARSGAREARGWASLYDVSPDWQPVIGQVGERVFVDAGTSGHGFKLSPVLGAHVARLLLDDADPRLREFHPDRFTADDRLASGFGAARILG